MVDDIHYCVKVKSDGVRCGNRARPGMRYCHFHRQFENAGRPATNPKTVLKQMQSKLSKRATELLDLGFDPLDLQPLLTTQHLLRDKLEKLVDGENVDMEKLESVLPLLISLESEIGKNVERVERIRASKAFTASERDWVVLALFDFVEMLPDELKPKFQEFIETRLLLRSSATPKALTVGKSPDA